MVEGLRKFCASDINLFDLAIAMFVQDFMEDNDGVAKSLINLFMSFSYLLLDRK